MFAMASCKFLIFVKRSHKDGRDKCCFTVRYREWFMHGTVYVMVAKGRTRIGHHTTKNGQRIVQVVGGIGHPCKMIRSIRLSSKLEACAAEAVAHVMLAKYESRMPSKKGKTQVFNCSSFTAAKAISEAVCLLETKRLVKRKIAP
jgi:hypothetical protein